MRNWLNILWYVNTVKCLGLQKERLIQFVSSKSVPIGTINAQKEVESLIYRIMLHGTKNNSQKKYKCNHPWRPPKGYKEIQRIWELFRTQQLRKPEYLFSYHHSEFVHPDYIMTQLYLITPTLPTNQLYPPLCCKI